MQSEEGRIVAQLHDVVIRMLDSGIVDEHVVYESLLSKLKVCRKPSHPELPLKTVGVTVEAVMIDAVPRKRNKKSERKGKSEKHGKDRKEGDGIKRDGDRDAMSNALSTFPFKTIDDCTSSARSRTTFMSKEDLIRRIDAHEPSRSRMPVNFNRLKKSVICEELLANGSR